MLRLLATAVLPLAVPALHMDDPSGSGGSRGKATAKPKSRSSRAGERDRDRAAALDREAIQSSGGRLSPSVSRRPDGAAASQKQYSPEASGRRGHPSSSGGDDVMYQVPLDDPPEDRHGRSRCKERG
jgi:hypothetical protein